MHDSDLYEKLKHSLEVLSLDCQEISDSFNQVFEILESRILMHFHEFNVLFKHFFEEYDKKNVDTILKIKEILKEHSLLKKNYERLFQEQFLDLTPFCNIDEEWAWSSDDTYQIVFEQKVKNEILDFYKGDESVFFNFKESVIEHELPFDNIKYNSLCFYDPEITFGEIGKRRVLSAIKRLYSIFVVVANYIESHLDISSFVTSNIHEAIVKEFKVYSKNNELNTLRELKRLAQKFKSSRSSPLTEEIWGELMRVEDCILENTISGISSSTDEEGGNFFDEYTLQEMKDNNGLVQKILNISSDESLFDFKYAFEPHINLLSSLNDNNLQLFYQLILRRNLIQCEMFPELKAKYREFVNGEAKEDEDKEHSNNAQVKIDEVNPTPFVIRSEQSEEVIAYIKELMASKTNPKDILKPLRAAQDAGVIRRPTWDEFQRAFPDSGVRSKSSLTTYTKADAKPYENDKSFEEMVEDFKKRFLSN